MSSQGWIGVDLDATLAEYHGWQPDGGIGDPIPVMVDRVKEWLAHGRVVKIFTARLGGRDGEERAAQQLLIEAWCEKHLGVVLPITATKDFQMISLYDDRCIQVEQNTGRLIGEG